MSNTPHDILIVDDEPNVLTALRRMLHGEPYRVHVASDPSDALESLKSIEPAVMISDYRMPGMTGVAFLQRAKELQPDSVRIILSGYADISAIIDAINTGEIFRFIAKPWNDDELKLTIKQSLEHWQLMKSNRELSTELLKTNRELKELNEHLEAEVAKRSRDLLLKDRSYLLSKFIIEHTPIPLIGIDENGMIALANRQCSDLFPGAGSVLLGRDILSIFSKGNMSELRVLVRNKRQSTITFELGNRSYNLIYIPIDRVPLTGSALLAFVEAVGPLDSAVRSSESGKERIEPEKQTGNK
ncbi:response regulator [bacterium]|nr:response regulator [bacterium]MBU1638661.1 response regulator [bacterium]MBU1920837.1 response regulator [bacterium]